MWEPPGKYADDFSKRPVPKHCERWPSNQQKKMAEQCFNQVEYQSEQNGLYFCSKCAHDVAKLAKVHGYTVATFRKVELLESN